MKRAIMTLHEKHNTENKWPNIRVRNKSTNVERSSWMKPPYLASFFVLKVSNNRSFCLLIGFCFAYLFEKRSVISYRCNQRRFDVLPNFSFTTSETMRVYFTWKLELVSNILWMIVGERTMDCEQNESVALNVYSWNWTMFAQIKRRWLTPNDQRPSG